MRSVFVGLFVSLIGCVSVEPVSAADAVTFKEKVLWSFGNGDDGQSPAASLFDVKGVLYGTTYLGGGEYSGGTLFAFDTNTRQESILFSFYDDPDASMIDVKGTLYGTTAGGDWDGGTVFSYDPATGTETTVHSFEGNDGVYPTAGLIKVDGTLYGTTQEGGAHVWGTVFSLDPATGTETVLYSFCGRKNCADGNSPVAGLIGVRSLLYGTTSYGGGTGCGGEGCGTVFAVNRKTGKETVVYSFCSQANCADGSWPVASLIDMGGILYGTTQSGGPTGCGDSFGCGTVFSVDTVTGAEKALYSFCSQENCTDGARPFANVIDVNGTLYGTTTEGGANNAGTVFAIDPSTGAETVLYSFCSQQNCVDGAGPWAGLIAVNGKFYGTTTAGGVYNGGTVFMLKQKP